jgi:predicted Zn-dependent protease
MVEIMEKIARYRKLHSQDPQSRVYVPLADLLREKGEYEEALSLLENGLARNPGHQAAMVVLGRTLLQAGRRDHGVKILQRVLELSPDNFVVLRSLAECFVSKEEFAQARPLLERLTELEPEQPEWSKLLGDATERQLESESKIPDPAGDQPSEESPMTPDEEFATMTLVDILVAQGYVDKALVALKRMRDIEPDRKAILDRIAELQGGLAEFGKKSGPHTNPQDEYPINKLERARIRANQKEQFGEWIEGLKSQEDGLQ